MKSSALKAFPREQSGRTGVRKIRARGRVPAVIYGRKTAPRNLELDEKELEHLIHSAVTENLVVDLSIDQDDVKSRLAVVQEVQHSPVSGSVLHVDFHEVDETEPVEIQVPLEAQGEAIGVKQTGGMLEHVVFKVRVKALPRDLPEVIFVDVSNLEAGHSIHIRDITPPERVEVLGDPDVVVVSIAEPRKAQEAEGELAAEVEVKESAAKGEGAKEKS